MGITAFQGPNITYGVTGGSTNGLTLNPVSDYNDQRAPDVSDLGYAMMDPRAAYQYQVADLVTNQTYGLMHSRGFVDYVPITTTTSALVANSVVSTGVTTFTITASSSLGTYSTTIVAPESGLTTGTLLAIDSTAAYVSFGQSGSVVMWNPAAGTGRAISITTSSSGDAGTYSIAGRDMYGYKMTETLAITEGTSNSSGYSLTSKKAFKYISSITNTTTPTSTGVSIGITDKYGLPLKTTYFGHDTTVRILASAYSSAVAVAISSANAVPASTVATQTSTTPDVRGTYTSTTASNGTLRMQIACVPTVAAISSISPSDMSSLFGGTQFSSV
jgi:hypothetical protein